MGRKMKTSFTSDDVGERVHQVKIRMTDLEKIALMQAVLDSGMGMQEYILMAVKAANEGKAQNIIDTSGLLEMLPEMKHQGNNLNQIAKALNSGGTIDQTEFDAVMQEVKATWQQLRQYLQEQASAMQ